MQVLVAGFHHETNTFAPTQADWAAFESGSSYPAYSRGDAMLELLAGSSLPVGGFVRGARTRGLALVPSGWAGASPSAHVTRDAFERVCADVLEDARRGGFDAIYLDLHGAAVAEHVDDAEGELLARLRAVVGHEMPIVASLDLHANVTERMLSLASAMTAFRTYPHVDMAATGERALGMLLALLDGAPLGRRHEPKGRSQGEYHSAQREGFHCERVPFLLPLNAQCTLQEPAGTVMRRMAALEAQHGVQLSFAMGFPAADFAECGPMVFGYGPQIEAVQRAVRALRDEVVSRRKAWTLDLRAPREAVEQAIALASQADAPVVVADTQDNPGAGGDSNTTGMLRALLECGAGRRFPGRVALGLLHDPDAARAACDAGIGATLELSVGRAVPTYDGGVSDAPLTGMFTVRATSDGVVPLHGPMMAGSTVRLGASACVEIDGVLVLLASGKCQMLDLGLYRFLSVEPAAMKILVNKSSVHFRAAFTPIASHILVAKARGPMAADPADLPWRHLPDTMARRP